MIILSFVELDFGQSQFAYALSFGAMIYFDSLWICWSDAWP